MSAAIPITLRPRKTTASDLRFVVTNSLGSVVAAFDDMIAARCYAFEREMRVSQMSGRDVGYSVHDLGVPSRRARP